MICAIGGYKNHTSAVQDRPFVESTVDSVIDGLCVVWPGGQNSPDILLVTCHLGGLAKQLNSYTNISAVSDLVLTLLSFFSLKWPMMTKLEGGAQWGQAQIREFTEVASYNKE